MTDPSSPLSPSLRLAANLSTLFQELPFEARPRAAQACGFAGLEVQFPYDLSAAQWQAAVGRSGLPMVLLNAPKGKNGEPGLASLADRKDEFLSSLRVAAEYAAALDCPLVHVLAGIGGDRSCYLENLALARDIVAPAGATVVIEVLNQIDVPGYHLRSIADAQQVIDAVPGIGLQYDLYHAARSREDIPATLRNLRSSPSHVQISSCPGRNEPDHTTLIDLQYVIDMGYCGWVGCEYWPASTTRAGLGWAASLAG